MSILFSVVGLMDQDAAIQAARDETIAAIVLRIAHGNDRNLKDTAQRMREKGAATKAGKPAESKKGRLLAALLAAINAATAARTAFAAQHREHLSRKLKPTAPMLAQAEQMASSIGDAFEAAAVAALASRPKAAKTATPDAPRTPPPDATPDATPDVPPDPFTAFMADAVRALGRDKIIALLSAAMVAEAEAEAAEAEAEAEAEAAAAKLKRGRKAA